MDCGREDEGLFSFWERGGGKEWFMGERDRPLGKVRYREGLPLICADAVDTMRS
ncbi:hypothetical protein D3C73_1473460 [compost metagenome]